MGQVGEGAELGAEGAELGDEDEREAAAVVALLIGVAAGVDPACRPLAAPQDSMAKMTRAIATARPDFTSQFVSSIASFLTKVTSHSRCTTILARGSFDAYRVA